jgi:hypothetical protein
LLSAGSTTDAVLQNCSAAYTRSRWFHDNALRDAAHLLALAVARDGFRHVDCALVVRNHHGEEVATRRHAV